MLSLPKSDFEDGYEGMLLTNLVEGGVVDGSLLEGGVKASLLAV